MEKHLVQIEFRYSKVDKYGDGYGFTSRMVTIGVYDTFEEAAENGNKLMEKMEAKFPIHVFPNGKGKVKRERFSKNGGCFGGKKNLITDMAYLKTPFQFFAKITTLNYEPIDEAINDLIEEGIKYRKFRREQQED